MTSAPGEAWVLPEKYEDGLVDEKGEPLSKRCVLEWPGAGRARMPLHCARGTVMMAERPAFHCARRFY